MAAGICRMKRLDPVRIEPTPGGLSATVSVKSIASCSSGCFHRGDLPGRATARGAFAPRHEEIDLGLQAADGFFQRAAHVVVSPLECQSKPSRHPNA